MEKIPRGNRIERISILEGLIKKYQDSYYNKEAEISDSEFDLLWDELTLLDPANPLLQKVGSSELDLTDGFPKAKHLIPMGSQDKAADPEEFLEWAKKAGLAEQNEDKALPVSFIAQYKLDGASLELQYNEGKLERAVTRGDGITGDDISANALRMNGTVSKLPLPFNGGIRGEVIMTREIHKSKYSAKANCRNAANGIMRRKDGAGCEDLCFMAYDASAPGDDEYFVNELEKLKWLEKCGFNTVETKSFSSAADIIAWRSEVAASRESLPFDIDGLVVKDIAIDMADLRKARPERQIAFKFELESAFSILRAVEWSESGATYTPIGIIEPVRLAGTTVQRANLNNPGLIRAMGLKIGAAVTVVKRGEIIPKIESLAPEGALPVNPGDLEEITHPDCCESCGAELSDTGTRLFCPNTACPKRLHHRLEKWVDVLEIRELGKKLLFQLFQKKRLTSIASLYTLTAEELADYDRMGEISAAKVVRHIQTKREISLSAFIAGFDFENIGELVMDKVTAAGFNTLEKLRSASVGELAEIYGLGEISAKTIFDGLLECAEDMDSVLDLGFVSIADPPDIATLPLNGLSFCFTGELTSLKRSQAEEKVKIYGGAVKTSVTKDLSFLVCNDPESNSGKIKKAKDLNIKIINEIDFIDMLKNPASSAEPQTQGELF